MYFEEDFVLGVENTRRRRGNRFICECGEVLGNRDDHCGCKGNDVADITTPNHQKHCSSSCACKQLRNLSRNDVVLFSTGDALSLLTALFINYDARTGCVTLRLGTADVYVDCKDIKVLVVV